MMRILNIGSLNIDFVYSVPHFVRPGETLASFQMNSFCGGKGLNQSIALARAGASVSHAGMVGEKDGDMLVDMLKNNGVDTGLIARVDCPSGHTIIQVDEKGQNCILLFGGSNRRIDWAYVENVLAHFSAGDFIVLQNEVSMMPEIIRAAKDRGLKIVLNPSPMSEDLLNAPLELVDYFILNEVEAADLCGGGDKTELLASLRKKYPSAAIVLTLGKEGVLYQDENSGVLSHGIYDVPVVDTTAAGDTFTGYFVASLIQGEPVEECLRLASVASSIAVGRPGAAPSIPYMKEVSESRLVQLA